MRKIPATAQVPTYWIVITRSIMDRSAVAVLVALTSWRNQRNCSRIAQFFDCVDHQDSAFNSAVMILMIRIWFGVIDMTCSYVH